jgi:hypothetical protein
MTNTLDRLIDATQDRIVLLAPSTASVSGTFDNVEVNGDRHQSLVEELQRLRGSVYLKEGAIQRHQMSNDGRHLSPDDDRSWHLLLLDAEREVVGCMLYTEYDRNVRFEDTRAVLCPLIQERQWRQTIWRAMEEQLAIARKARIRYVEFGGWAAAEHIRRTPGPLGLALAMWAFSRREGGVIGVTTATHRHDSATILKRLGGATLSIDGEAIPRYFDKRYGCDMELLRFDTRAPKDRYRGAINKWEALLTSAPVIARPSWAYSTPVQPAGQPALAAPADRAWAAAS